jgi:hypothetical protein
LTRIFTSLSIARFTGTRIFMVYVRRSPTGFGFCCGAET